MSGFRFYCPKCQQRLGCDEQFSGREIQCPACKVLLRIPPVGGKTKGSTPEAGKIWATVISPEHVPRPQGSMKFPTTEWTKVLKAVRNDSTEAMQALERLCQTYWYPLYAFVRRRGYDSHAAEDLTQDFFAHLFEQDALKKLDRESGRFRSFLLAAVNHFIINDWKKRQTQKRGGARQIISWDEMDAEERYQKEPADLASPERLFEQRWAFTLIELVLERLRREYDSSGKMELFICLEPHLTDEPPAGFYANAAVQLNMTEGALKTALHRFRRHFGTLLRQQIAQTVGSPEMIEDEIRSLFAAISK